MQEEQQQNHKFTAQAIEHWDDAEMSVIEVVNMVVISDITTGSWQ